ncbi:MAG: TraB/GumN family protein, partial [Flavobacterium sp.]
MKKHFLLSLLFFSLILQAQKDNSLFWEISGNGLQKKSYLYGTMHVNDKVSYHLSDSFFKNLLQADMVANESNPETWNDAIDVLKEKKSESPYNFYSQFYLFPIRKESIQSLFLNSNYFSSMLGGIESPKADFQESTVLDMFIFQTGKKYGKKIVGLESAKASVITLLSLTGDDVRPIESNVALLSKISKNRNLNEVLKQYYREKDVVMLDSLYKLAFSKRTHDLLITNRNVIMAKSIDSLSRIGSLFSAVGAAHLGGKMGIISLLRQKGYTVTPIFDTFTDDGIDKKKAIETYFPNPNFEPSGESDGMIKIPLPKKHVYRRPLNDFMSKNGEKFDPKSLDSLFYENIAGNIIEKRYSEQANARIYDIKNTTKSGNAQHYRFYVTPLEVISVSMLGSGNYVRQYENDVFDRIKIKPFGSAWETVSPEKGGFSVSVPTFNFAYGADLNQSEDIQIQAFDNDEKGYYFLTEKTISDTGQLENTEFEHRQIHYQFYHQLEMDSVKTRFDKDRVSFGSQSSGSGKIKLRSFIKGQKYYVLGTVGISDKNSAKFFDSFVFVPLMQDEASATFSDLQTGYKISLPEKENNLQFIKIGERIKKDKNIFDAVYRYRTFHSASGTAINFRATRFSKYQYEASMDSLRNTFRKTFLIDDPTADDFDEDEYEDEDNYGTISLLNPDIYRKKGFCKSTWNTEIKSPEPEKYTLLSQNESFDKATNIRTFTATVGRGKSSQVVRHKILLREDGYLMLSALLDKSDTSDHFVEKAFASLDFAEPSKNSAFENNKLKSFIADARSAQDTIRYSALNSVFKLDISSADFEEVAKFMNTFEFKDDETETQISLLEKMGEVKDSRAIPFFEKYYKRTGVNAAIQLGILKALTSQKSKAAYLKIIELMKSDLPLSDNQYDITFLFTHFENDLENSKTLFPAVFQFYATEEYKAPVISFCNRLLEKGIIPVKSLAPFKKMILENANTKAKRLAARSKPTEDDYDSVPEPPLSDLIDYVDVLYNFTQEKEVTTFFTRLKTLDDTRLNIELLRLAMISNSLSDTEIAKALEKPQMRYPLIQLLLNTNKLLPGSMSDDEIAKSAVINLNAVEDKNPIELLEKRTVSVNGKDLTFYFFQGSTKNTETMATDTILYPIAFITENGRIKPLSYNYVYSRYNIGNEQLTQTYDSII